MQDQNIEDPLREQLDRLVVGKSYVSDAFWADEVSTTPLEIAHLGTETPTR
jgi:hypothetical protein